ncbi:Six-hairpin glycosidase [Marasmius fiardii PR-910]|nr:Six-hairpin glycosidase [Marasmius fiardii PR-910]
MFLTTCILLLTLAFSVHCTIQKPWTRYIYAPTSRTPRPERIFATHGKVDVNGLDVRLNGSKSQVTFDFGREVGGQISFLINSPSSTTPAVSLSFSESPQFIGEWSDDTGASPFSDWDQSLDVSIPQSSLRTWFNYTTPPEKFRGGFRYLTITSGSNESVRISSVICLLGFHPGVQNLQDAYRGYFYTPNDDLLVRIWYAGAYTVQTNIAPPDTGRFLPQIRPGWAYNSSLGVPGVVLLDGAKRDRAVWPGDLGISAPSSYLAFGPVYGYECVLNALETLFYYQNDTDGMFPFSGPDTNSFRGGSRSDVYHSWTLVAVEEYVFYSGDMEWVGLHWENITRAVEFTINGITELGLQNQTNLNDWAREGGGGLNSALNAVTYGVHVLLLLSNLASLHGDFKNSDKWKARAEELKKAYNALLWDDESGLYRDNTTTTLHPQDANSFAVVFNLTISDDQNKRISKGLMRNWNEIGPVTPELKDTISLFVSSWELNAHFQAGEPDRAIDLVRRLWGYSLDGPDMGGTTIVEGLSANGSLYYRSEAGYNYDPTYTSLSHSWSTGPTRLLITHLLGLRIVSSQGRNWEIVPNVPMVSGEQLKEVRGGFETVLGMFEAEWTVIAGGLVRVKVKAPDGTSGKIRLGKSDHEVKGDGAWNVVVLRLE